MLVNEGVPMNDLTTVKATKSDPPIRTSFDDEFPDCVSFGTFYKVAPAERLKYFPDALSEIKGGLEYLAAQHAIYSLPGFYENNDTLLRKEAVLSVSLDSMQGSDGIFRFPGHLTHQALARHPMQMWRCFDEAFRFKFMMEQLCAGLNKYEFGYRLDGEWYLIHSVDGAAGMDMGGALEASISTEYTQEEARERSYEVGLSVTAGIEVGAFRMEATMSATFGESFSSMVSVSNVRGMAINLPSFTPTAPFILDVWQRCSKMCAVYRPKGVYSGDDGWISYGPVFGNNTNRIEYKIFPEGVLKVD